MEPILGLVLFVLLMVGFVLIDKYVFPDRLQVIPDDDIAQPIDIEALLKAKAILDAPYNEIIEVNSLSEARRLAVQVPDKAISLYGKIIKEGVRNGKRKKKVRKAKTRRKNNRRTPRHN
jgi:hypothetical protein